MTNKTETKTPPKLIPARIIELLGGELAKMARSVNEAITVATEAAAAAKVAAAAAERAPDLDAEAAADAYSDGKPLPKTTAPKAVADAELAARTAEAATIVAIRLRDQFKSAAARGPLAESRRAEADAKLEAAVRAAHSAVNAVAPAVAAIETAAREIADLRSAPSVGLSGAAREHPARLIGTAALTAGAWSLTPANLVDGLRQCLPEPAPVEPSAQT